MTLRLTYVVTHPITAKLLLRGQLRYMRERGYEVTVISSPGPELDAVAEREGVRVVGVEMARGVRPTEEPRAAWRLFDAIRLARPDILNASTPKASVLGLMAARALDVPVRVYLLRGLRLEGFSGFARSALGVAERVSAACSHHVVSVSESLRRAYIDGGYAKPEKVSVIPSNGIDILRFPERKRTRAEAGIVRQRLGISPSAIVAGFVGRLVTDKGAADLVTAVEHAASEVPGLRVLVVGGDFGEDSLPVEVRRRFAENPNIMVVGTVEDTAPYYAAMDLLVFPSGREGLPNVPLEAAASEVPAIGYRSTGVVDAIVDGETGRIVDRGDVSALAAAIVEYAALPDLRARHGHAGRQRVLARFTNERTWEAWAQLYEQLVALSPRVSLPRAPRH